MNVILIQWAEENWLFRGKLFRAAIFSNDAISFIREITVIGLSVQELFRIGGFEFSAKCEKLFIRDFSCLARFGALESEIN